MGRGAGRRSGQPMTLVEAFIALAPLVGDPATDAIRNEAARIVLQEFYACRVRLDCLEPLRDDAIQTALWRLVRRGPRSPRRAPSSDGAVRAYLRQAVLQNAISEGRNALLRSLELPATLTGADPDPSRLLDLEWARDELQAARAQFLREIVPAVVASTGSPFVQQALDDLIALDEDRCSPEDLISREAASDGDIKAARARIDQRHTRARNAVRKYLRQASRRGDRPAERLAALRVIVDMLYRRRETHREAGTGLKEST